MKKLLGFVLVMSMLLCLAACNNTDTSATESDDPALIVTNPTEPSTSATQEPTQDATTPSDEVSTAPSESSPTSPTSMPGTSCSHNWIPATCTAPKTCSECGVTEGATLPHQEVVIPGKLATFSVAGLTEGARCTVCDTVTKAQKTIPALGSDVVVGTDYYDKEGQTTYRYSYSFTLYENNTFELTTLKIGSDESYKLTVEKGRINYLNNSVYELNFDGGKETMYAKVTDGVFEFCNKDGSKWQDKEQRPQGTTAVTITPRPGNSVYGYEDLKNNTNGKSMQELYYRMYAACEAFVNSKEDIKAVNGSYVIDRISMDYYVLTTQEAIAVWKVFYVENPRYYWLFNTLSISGGVLELCIDPAYAKASTRSNCDALIDSMAAACASQLNDGMSQLQKAMTIHDFVLGKMNYAYKADGKTPEDTVWAHNMMGAAQKSAGVCESYAKTYQYLCRLNGLECLIATGYARENHAWNLVKIDGKWYGVDCTFDETNTSAVSYSCFGMNADRLRSDYKTQTPSGTGTEYLYKLPQVQTQGIELVDLYKNGNYVGLYANIDAAFSAMTDSGASYELKLYDYERKGILLLSAAVVQHRITSTQTPAVKQIIIRGSHGVLDSIYVWTPLIIDQELSLRSDMSLENMYVQGNGALNLKDKKLTCQGFAVNFDIPVSGNTDSSNQSELCINVDSRVEFFSTVRVHTVRQDKHVDCINFRMETYIVRAATPQIDCYCVGSTLIPFVIEEWCPPSISDTPRIQLFGLADVTVNKVSTACESVQFHFRFGKLEQFGNLTLGQCNTKALFDLEGQVTYVITDTSGNVVNEYVEAVKPEDLKCPIVTLKDGSLTDNFEVRFKEIVEGGWFFVAHTDEYTINGNNQIVHK